MKALIGSVIAASVLALLAHVGARGQTYDVNVAFHCAFEIAREDRPPADVVILGNSQSGAAIDTVYLSELLDKTGATAVEKLSVVRSDVTPVRLIAREYLEHRGTPELVVLQPMFLRSDKGPVTPGTPIHPRESLAFGDWDDVVEVRDTAVQDTSKGPLGAWARAGYRNTVRLWTDRQIERVVASLSVMRTRRQRTFCTSNKRFRLSGIWPHDTVPLKPGTAAGPTLDKDGLAFWKERMGRREVLDLSRAERRFEIDQNLRLIEELEAAGATVVLAGYPSLGRAKDDARELESFGQVLNRPTLDLYAGIDPADRERLESFYRDPVHVNFAGAQILTEALAKAIEGRTP